MRGIDGVRLVAGHHVEAVRRTAPEGPDGVVPPGELVEPAHLDGVLRRAAHATAAHVHDDHSVGVPRLEGDSVMDPDVMNATSGARVLEPGHPERVPGILGVHHVPAPAVVDGVDVPLVEEHVVDAARQLVVEARQDLGVPRVGHVQDHETVAAVRGAFAGDDGDGPVGRHLHVVHGPGVHLHLRDALHVRGIGHVEEQRVPVGVPGAEGRVVAPVDPLPDPQIGTRAVTHRGVSHELHGHPDVPGQRPGSHVRSAPIPEVAETT